MLRLSAIESLDQSSPKVPRACSFLFNAPKHARKHPPSLQMTFPSSTLPNIQTSLPLRTHERLHLIGAPFDRGSILSRVNEYSKGIREHRGNHSIDDSILSRANRHDMKMASWQGSVITRLLPKSHVIYLVGLLPTTDQSAGWSIT